MYSLSITLNFTCNSLQDGHAQYMCISRHADVDVCPVRAMAVHLFQRFTLGNEPFPLPDTDWDAFLGTFLFASNGHDISYDTQVGNLLALMACLHECADARVASHMKVILEQPTIVSIVYRWRTSSPLCPACSIAAPRCCTHSGQAVPAAWTPSGEFLPSVCCK